MITPPGRKITLTDLNGSPAAVRLGPLSLRERERTLTDLNGPPAAVRLGDLSLREREGIFADVASALHPPSGRVGTPSAARGGRSQ